MAYFNHAFCKTFLATSVDAAGGTATSALGSGQLGLAVDTNWQTVASAAGATGLLYLVQGSFRTSDTIGNNPGHGGYAESIKSKGINPRYVTRIWGSVCQAATQATSAITVASDCAPCGENLLLRLDVKGSPALRFLNHNAYAIGDSSGDAAANGGPLPGLCCVDGQEYLDPALALAAAAQMLLADPIIKPFVQELTHGTAKYGISVTSAALTLRPVASVAAPGVPTGTDYNVGDIVSIAPSAGGEAALVEVTAIGVGGTIDSVSLISGGYGHSTAAGVAVTNVVVADATAAGGTVDVTQGAVGSGTFAISSILNPVAGGFVASLDPVADAVSATVTFQGAYVDTQFGNCSFDTRDHYEKEPVQIIASLIDETGNPCNDCGVVVNTPGTMAQTLGHKVKKDLLLADAYMQNPYNQGNKDSARIREIEGSDLITGAVASNVALYRAYYLQHSVPRFNNPTGVFDNDQYLYIIYTPCDPADPSADTAEMLAIEGLLDTIATAAGLAAPDYELDS